MTASKAEAWPCTKASEMQERDAALVGKERCQPKDFGDVDRTRVLARAQQLEVAGSCPDLMDVDRENRCCRSGWRRQAALAVRHEDDDVGLADAPSSTRTEYLRTETSGRICRCSG